MIGSTRQFYSIFNMFDIKKTTVLNRFTIRGTTHRVRDQLYFIPY